VYLKLENLQMTGSFKLRGAANKILSLTEQEQHAGTVTASTGNHGHAVAYLTDLLGIPGTIYLPNSTVAEKVDALKLFQTDIRFSGSDCLDAESAARQQAIESGQVYISPYNDPLVIAGQATVGLDLLRQTDRIDAVLVPVGGGGLIAGISAWLKHREREIEIIGCQPERSRVMYESLKAGRIIEMESLPTLSNGTSGGIEEGALTFDICRRHVDEIVLISEEEIREALKLILVHHHVLIEGAAALPVAALLQNPQRWQGKTVVLVLSGSKISLDTLRTILNQECIDA
jgi:threonine dehydratase